MLGTDFPYTDWYPKGKHVIQIDERAAHIGRRTSVALGRRRPTRGWPPPACSSWSRPRATAGTSRPRTEQVQRLAPAPAQARRPRLRQPRASSRRSARRLTTPTSGSGPRRWRWRSTPTPPTTRSSPRTPACPRSGCRALSPCAAPGGCSAPTTSARWPTRCPRRSAPRRLTARARWWRSAATAA